MGRPARFQQEDLARAVRGVTKGGMVIGKIEIDRSGNIVILPAHAVTKGAANEWDADLR